MATPPDFGGREIEEGLIEDLGVPREERQVQHPGEEGPEWDGNEAHAVGQVCERCGTVITAHQEVRRRPDGRWVHETCPTPGA